MSWKVAIYYINRVFWFSNAHYYSLSFFAVGFPNPSLLIISDTGQIIEFSYLQKKLQLNGLPNLKRLQKRTAKNLYGFEHDGIIYFLSTSDSQNVVKYDIVSGQHSILPKSNYPITYRCTRDYYKPIGICDRTLGVHIRDYFWIILGK